MSKSGVNFQGEKSKNRISAKDARRQADTFRVIMDKLRRQPGVILADEVGMGKTYVALGVGAEYIVRNPGSRVLIITPSRELAEKWTQDLNRFRNENVSDRTKRLIGKPVEIYSRGVQEILSSKSKSRIWVLPISLLLNERSRDQAAIKEDRNLFFQILSGAARLNRPTSREIRQSLWNVLKGRGAAPRPRRSRYIWMGSEIQPRWNKLRAMLGPEDIECLQNGDFTRAHIADWKDRIRWFLIGESLRRFSLIVVDEAHHLRNPGTKRYRALESVFIKKFKEMLFLTATPFQLGPSELEHVLNLFQLSEKGTGRAVAASSKNLTEKTASYQAHVRRFEKAWARLDDSSKRLIDSEVSKGNIKLTGVGSDPMVNDFRNALLELRASHAEVKTALSEWVVRNVKDRSYRSTTEDPIPVDGDNRLPFALLHRLLYEYQLRERTFSAVQNLSLTSSWDALMESAVMRRHLRNVPSVRFYRQLLKRLGTKHMAKAHPKEIAVVSDVIQSFEMNEKVLVFASRIATVKKLQVVLNQEMERIVYSRCGGIRRDEVERRIRSVRKRITTARDPMWLRFQENRFHTLMNRVPDAEKLYRSVVCYLARLHDRYRVGIVGKAKGPDWRLLREVCEWLVFAEGVEFSGNWNDPAVASWRNYSGIEELDARKPKTRYSEDLETRVLRWHGCTRQELVVWVRTVLETRSIWDRYADYLSRNEGGFADTLDIRPSLLEAIRSAVMVPEFMASYVAKMGRKRGRTEAVVTQLFESKEVSWRIEKFLEYVRSLPEPEIRQFIEGLETANLVARASGDEGTADRLRYRYGFNSPFRPYVLVASDVMKEGLDLHRECSKVIHYDLAWNPALLEQRVGRIDRIGSKTDRELRSNPGVKLNISRRYLPGTIDERMFLRVRDRERWFKFILGNRPEWDSDADDRASAVRLPEALSNEFQIRLDKKWRS